ncbi:peroxiredoxin [Spectribacter hydrogenoxidans]|uniref:thioredoxin-dependent peroxiredoxin n=1 Tax=Spectribacter hydrogenoxidans TaxID=3075608 RepID=A0ABU3C1J3_9GAMM|nr:peroxiredoxin [Salinisphaera sp. W335]MDT0635431.1 peroxiredoxin [Salinisphaera sp. W335]
MSELLDRPAPDITLPATGDQSLSLADLRGQVVVLYFYPRDNTPGCTREGEAFRDRYEQFRQAGAEVLGVSRDTVQKHENFRAKYDFPFHLLADTEETACRAFGVLREKMMYGRKSIGIERSTFLIDDQGVVRREWRGVSVKGHADEVLQAIADL